MPMREAIAIAMVLVVPDVKCQSRTIRYTIRLLHFDGFERASQGGMHEFDDARASSGRLLSLLGGLHGYSSCETTEGRCSPDKSQSVLTVSSYNEDISCNKSAMRIQGVKCN